MADIVTPQRDLDKVTTACDLAQVKFSSDHDKDLHIALIKSHLHVTLQRSSLHMTLRRSIFAVTVQVIMTL